MINNTVLQNIYNDLLELADNKLQLDRWLKGDNGRISGYTELMCRLYDDDALEEFVAKDVIDLRLSDSFISEIKSLKYLLDSYDEKNKNTIEIINDINWIEITNQAKKVINYWKTELRESGNARE